MRGQRRSCDSGETLLEVVLSVLFVGLVVTTLVGGLGTAVTLGGSHRELTTADVELKSAVETLKGRTYVATGSTSARTAYQASFVAGAPTGFARTVTSVQCIPATAGSSFNVNGAGSCTPDTGLQLITVTLSNTGGSVFETTTFIKRRP